jgi:hypothetical protein
MRTNDDSMVRTSTTSLLIPFNPYKALPDDDDGDDIYLEYYSGKRFHINYSCLHVLRKTHKLVQ